MRSALAALAVVVALASPARAADAEAPSAEGEEEPRATWARVVVLQELIAGRYRDVVRDSREVEVVRDGGELLATPDMVLSAGDAVRTRKGRVVLERLDGGRITVTSGSQVRLDPDAGWLLRLGTLDVLAAAPERLAVGAVVVEGTADLRISRTHAGDGEVLVLEGDATIALGAESRVLAPGTRTAFTQDALAEPTVLALSEIEELSERHPTPRVGESLDREPARAHLRVHGGVSRIHTGDFGRFGVAARVRLGGPVFLGFGGGFAFRPVDEDLAVDAAFVVPAHLGVRFVAPLPRAFLLLAGLDFTLYAGEWCAGTGCVDEIRVEPGARFVIGTGIEINKVLGLDVTFAGGVARRRIPASVDPEEPVIPDLQMHLSFGVFFRI